MELIQIKLSQDIENRIVYYKDGSFYTVDDRNHTVELPRETIIQYLYELIDAAKNPSYFELDHIRMLTILDQHIFSRECWKGDEERTGVMIQKLIDSYKVELREYCDEDPAEVIKMVRKLDESDTGKEVVNSYLIQLMKERVIDSHILASAGFWDKDRVKELVKRRLISVSEVVKLQIEGALSRETAMEVIGERNAIDTYKRASRNGNKRQANAYAVLLGNYELCSLYLNGDLNRQEIQRIPKEIINQLPEEAFVRFAKKGFPDDVVFSSEELVNGYVTRFSGSSLINLAKMGYVKPETLLDLVDVKVDPDNEDRSIKNDEILSLYTPELVARLLKEQKIDSNFVKKLDEEILSKMDEGHREDYIRQLCAECKSQMDRKMCEKIIISLIEESNLPTEYFENNEISTNTIEDMFYNDMLPEERAIGYFNNGLLSLEDLKNTYGQDADRLIELVKQGKLNQRALVILSAQDLSDYLIDGKISMQDVFSIYANYDGIDEKGLKYVVDEYEADLDLREEAGEDVGEQIRIVDLIDENFDTSKIRDLFINNVITHGNVLELRDRGIITEEQCEEISKIDMEKEYDDIFGRTIKSNPIETTGVGPGTKGERKKSGNRKTSREENERFFKELGASDFRDIKANDPTSPFKGYTVVGFRDYGLVVLENFDRKNNGTYIMTLQEFRGCVAKDSKGDIVISKSKRAIMQDAKAGKAINKRGHWPSWGYNVIDSMKELSPQARRGVKTGKQIELAKRMIDEYFRPRIEENRNDENALALIEARRQNEYSKVTNREAKKMERELKALTKGKSRNKEGEEQGD